jgi:predicted extracellular nuclease
MTGTAASAAISVVALAGVLATSDAFAQGIAQIQGAGHVSPLAGQAVTTTGIVTALAFNGFYLQDPEGDGDENTSDGLFAFTGASPGVAVGDLVELTGSVSEFIPGGAGTGNLSTTQIVRPAINVRSSGHPLPEPAVIGKRGRVPPNVDVISEDEIPTNLQDAAGEPFDPDEDGIDFFESLEGMRVAVEKPVAVSAVQTFSAFSSEFFTLADEGKLIAPKNGRTIRRGREAGIALQPDPDNQGDQNPERVQIQIDATLYPGEVPLIGVGAKLDDVIGVMDYDFGNFEVRATEIFDFKPSRLRPEVTRLRGGGSRATVASYNVLNLSAVAADDAQRATVASHIAENLKGPYVVALQEIQDNNGDIDDPGNEGCESAPDGVVDASQTLQALVDAIVAAGGPTYMFATVDPDEGTSGGVPCGNIRNAFLYDPTRLELIELVSLTPDILASYGVGNPDAFAGTRDPLLGRFDFRGAELVVVNNHLTSRSGSTPIFGGPQPFVQAGEAEREAQVLALHEAVRFLIDQGSENVVVLGDLNTFDWTDDLAEILPRGPDGGEPILVNLMDTLTPDKGHHRKERDRAPTAGGNEAYSYIFEGNSQALDHLFVSKALAKSARFDVVHVNVDFPAVDDSIGSDHEPILARLGLSRPRQIARR